MPSTGTKRGISGTQEPRQATTSSTANVKSPARKLTITESAAVPTTPGKVKRQRRPPNTSYCVCGDKQCDEAMETLKTLCPSRYAYFLVPSKVKDLKDPQGAKKKELLKRDIRRKKRARFLQNLGRKAAQRVEDPSYSSETKHRFASLHLHPSIFSLCTRTSSNNCNLPESIPRSLGLRLSREGYPFTKADEVPGGDGEYLPIPNISSERFQEEVGMMGKDAEAKQSAAQLTTPAATRGQKALLTPTAQLAKERDEMEALYRRREQQLKDREDEINRKEKALTKQEKAYLDKRKQSEEAIKRRIQEIEEKERAAHLKDTAAGYGFSRRTLTSRKWHKQNPEAATHLFGFRSWKETVLYIHALFGIYPPIRAPSPSDNITPFEACLMAKLRMQLALPITTIALIWGPKERSGIGRHISKWARLWGEAGEDLSILNITPSFLRATCPQAYKDEGLENVCAVPDGKDFKIFTPRKNSLFTRACRSEKVHASAVRCISWSTPMGLSFEHTKLFLARASEKRLVELWGKRMKKCPRGWVMLSDRGFADTARFYPNMNHQKTPKFLGGRKQFSAAEVSADRTICKLRYTCEVAFSRVTKTRGLRDVISDDFFPILDAMNDWGHASVNLDRPLLPL